MKENPFNQPVSFEKYETNPISDLESAIKSGDTESLFKVVEKIDRTITSSSTGAFSATAPDGSGPQVRQEMQDFIDKFAEDPERARIVIYLGDGGYSRLIIDGTEDGGIDAHLSPRSHEPTKQKWSELTA